jgi:hypothetical protein
MEKCFVISHGHDFSAWVAPFKPKELLAGFVFLVGKGRVGMQSTGIS